MLNDGLAASSVGSYMPLCSQSGPKCASIAAGSNDLARLSRPGVAGEVEVAGTGRADSVIVAIKNGIHRMPLCGLEVTLILFDTTRSATVDSMLLIRELLAHVSIGLQAQLTLKKA